MTLAEVKTIIETRMSAENGNYTEKSLLWEIHNLLEELKERRENDEKKLKCDGGISCPHKKRNPCCYFCPDYELCDFEDKCFYSPDECGNRDYRKGAKGDAR